MMHSKKRIAPTPPTITDYVLTTIRERILSGEYRSGQRLEQKALADELGVSMIPVRESFRKLEAEGFIEIVPRRGASVAQISIEELEQIYLARGVLEELVANLAAPNLQPSTLKQLEEYVRQVEEAARVKNFDLMIQINRDFHFAIYQASKRPLLVDLISTLYDRSERYRRLYSYLPDKAAESLAAHRQILAAATAREAGELGRLVRRDIQIAEEGIIDQFRRAAKTEETGRRVN